VSTQGAESAVYDCLVVVALLRAAQLSTVKCQMSQDYLGCKSILVAVGDSALKAEK